MVFHTNQQAKLFKKSALAMCVMALSAPSFAADAPKAPATKAAVADTEEVVVTGMKEALGSAQDIKKHSATVVDSITSDDMGAFPDKSVAEALQRVAGITVNRFSSGSDTAHFSAEPSGVIVRGLQQVRSEFNGRDTFSANSSRGLSWGDLSPDLLAGVDVYKNQMAELIEGGIAGSVNLRTRLPFDQSGTMAVVNVKTNYGDLRKEWAPEVSGLYSTRWETGVGEFGVMGNLAYSDTKTRTNGIQEFRMNRFLDRPEYGPGLKYIPAAVNFRDTNWDRDRTGINLAAQWKDSDEKFVASLQFNKSNYHSTMEEHVVQASPADFSFSQSVFYIVPNTRLNNGNIEPNPNVPLPLPGTPAMTFNSQGLFQTGTLTNDIGWWGANDADAAQYAKNSAGQPMVKACYGWNGCTPARRGLDMTTVTRSSDQKNMTQDIGFNLKWNPSDTVHAVFDLQYVDATVKNYDMEVDFNSFANVNLDLSGRRPVMKLLAPSSVNQSAGGFTNPNNYYIRALMDHYEDSDGTELASKVDFKFDLDTGWIDSVKVGARFADREQTVRWSGYNWQNVANTWTTTAQSQTIPDPTPQNPNNTKSVAREYQNAYFNLDSYSPAPLLGTGATLPGTFKGYPKNLTDVRHFETSYGKLNPNDFVFANMDLISNRQLMASTMSATALGLDGGTGWDPICSNTGDRSGEEKGTCFTPSEISDVAEITSAVYFQVNFGGEDAQLFGKPITGNIGVRAIQTTIESNGGVVLPRTDPNDLVCKTTPPPQPGQPPQAVPGSIGCYLSADDIKFANGANYDSTSTTKTTNFLPSFNIKFELTDEWFLRFALSKAMSRPDIGNLRNYVGVGKSTPSLNNAADPLWKKDSAGNIIGANVYYSGGAQNPTLKPVQAKQADIALEYYFAKVGSFTMTAFSKQFTDYIQFGKYNRSFTNNGVTRTAEINGPLNGDGAGIKGMEFAFTRFFDFLPAPFDGLGIQTNYTVVQNRGVTNSNVQSVGGTGTTLTGQAPDVIKVNALESLSEHAYNIVAMYEKGPLALRAAYNWQSATMVTAIDCCVAYPIWNEPRGQLDASVHYKINDSMEVSLEGSNLLNAETVTKQQVDSYDATNTRLPNAWFQNDRRYTLGFRYKF